MKTQALEKTPAKKTSNMSKLRRKDNWQLFSLTIPGLAVLALFSYIPMFGIVLAFKNYNYRDGMFGSPWVGFKNFEFFFKTNLAERLLTNTLELNILYLLVNTVVTIILGLMLFELKNRLAIRVYQTVVFLPFIVSWVAAAYANYANLDQSSGIINSLLKSWGMQPVKWYFTPQLWTWILMFWKLWKLIGHGMIIYYGNLMNVDSALFEAAKLDGANRVQVMWHISWPHIRPVVISFFILSLGSVFSSDYGLFYYMTDNNAMLYSRTDVIDTYVIRALQSSTNLGMTTAIGLMQSVAGFIMLMLVNKIASWIDENGTVF